MFTGKAAGPDSARPDANEGFASKISKRMSEPLSSIPFTTDKSDLWAMLNLEARHWFVIAIVVAPIAILALLIYSFKQDSKPLKRRKGGKREETKDARHKV